MSLAGADGTQDVFVEQYYFGRHNFSGIWSQQRNDNLGGFSSTTRFGNTRDLLVTGNFHLQLPIKTGIFGIYADAGAVWNDLGFSHANATSPITTVFNTGIALKLGDTFGVYFPVWMSQILEDSYGSMNYAERIRFTLKFNLFQDGLNLGSLLN
jgi:hypothetical protein